MAVQLADDLERRFSKRDLILIAAMAAGAEIKEIAEFLQLKPDTLYGWISKNDEIKPMAAALATLVQMNKKRIQKEAIDDFMAEFKLRDRASLEAFDRALQSDDDRLAYDASKEHRLHRLGMPKSKLEVGGKVDHIHMHQIDPKVLSAFEADVLKDAPLMAARARLQITGTSTDDDGTAIKPE